MGRAAWLALGAVAGAFAGTAPELPGAALLIAVLAAVAIAIVGAATRRLPLAVLGIGAALVLGRVLAGSLAAPPDPQTSAPRSLDGAAEHSAVVLSLGTPDGGLQRAVLELRPPEPADRVYAWLPRYPPVVPTDTISFTGSLEPAPTEPGFGDYLARIGVAYTARPREMERVGSDDSPLAGLEQLRRGAGNLIAGTLPEPHAGLATAMMIGLRDLVARDVAEDFRTSGLSHVVAISGWHIALLGATVSALLRGVGRRPRSLVVVLAVCGYAILAGASPSVVRAAAMASVVLVARESGRRGRASAALALAATGMLLVEPATVVDIGFQLSVVATAGLLAWAAPMKTLLQPRLPPATPKWLVEALAVSLSAQAATLPFVLFHFGRLSLVAPLANLLVAPLVAPVMLLTLVALVCGGLVAVGIPSLVVAPFTLVGALGIGAMIAIADISAGLPYASIELPPPLNLLSAGLAAAVLGILTIRRRRPRPKPVTAPHRRSQPVGPQHRRVRLALAAGGLGLALAATLAPVVASHPDGRLHLTVLDVGQGDSMLLEGPRGGRMLVDAGPDPDRLIALLDQRLPAWDRRLDIVVLTHPHEDHVAGVALLLDRYRVGELTEPGMVGLGPGDAAYRRRMAELGREPRIIAAGDRLWLDGARIDVRWPLPGQVPLRPRDGGKAVNNVSIVLDVRYGSRRMLLSGDIEEEIDPRLLASDLVADSDQPLDVLKVAHHGSRTATTDAFVAQLDPRIAVISAGWGNPYGHPSPQTVARLEANGARLFRTDLDGTVEITTDGSDLVAHAGGGRPRPTRQPQPAQPAALGPVCPIPLAGGRRQRLYNRARDGPHARRGSADPVPPRSAAVAAPPLDGRGRRRRLPCPRDRAAGDGDRRRAGRDGRAAA